MPLYGIETEYGLAVEGSSPQDQLEHAMQVVNRCRVEGFEGWDYSAESPRADIRGFEAKKLEADPVDAQFDVGRRERSERELRADRVLVNGARFYNDHGHPEYATPECARLLDLVAHDRAGERIVFEAAKAYQQEIGREVSIYKNNTDFHGAGYGTHENYLVPRSLNFDSLLHGLLPLLITRQILTGAGKVGSEVRRPARYQLTQRADFFSELASVDTLYRRPIFNTRDEPHADPEKWLRLHVICGDANRMEWATAMKVAMINVAIELLELNEAPHWRLCNPIRAFESLSKDEKFEWRLELDNGNWTTGIEVLESYLAAGEKLLAGKDAETDWLLLEWRLAIEDTRVDYTRLQDRVDWVAKLAMLNEFAEQEGKWDGHTMQALDLQYHDLDPEQSLFGALEDMGRVRSFSAPNRVLDAMTMAPGNTRAALRGQAVARFGDSIKAVGWRRCVFESGGQRAVGELPVEVDDWQKMQAEVELNGWLDRLKNWSPSK